MSNPLRSKVIAVYKQVSEFDNNTKTLTHERFYLFTIAIGFAVISC